MSHAVSDDDVEAAKRGPGTQLRSLCLVVMAVGMVPDARRYAVVPCRAGAWVWPQRGAAAGHEDTVLKIRLKTGGASAAAPKENKKKRRRSSAEVHPCFVCVFFVCIACAYRLTE